MQQLNENFLAGEEDNYLVIMQSIIPDLIEVFQDQFEGDLNPCLTVPDEVTELT